MSEAGGRVEDWLMAKCISKVAKMLVVLGGYAVKEDINLTAGMVS
jgi:hypothetical protein